MEKHKGEIIEKIVRKSGYPLAILAKRLYISRNTLYKRFKRKNLPYDFILAVGHVIGYDFSTTFPVLKNITTNIEDKIKRAKDRYIRLLERHINLLTLAAVIMKNTKREEARKEIADFLEANIYEIENNYKEV